MKKFKFVCSLCVKMRLKAEKRKGKGKTKGKVKGSAPSPGGNSSETAVDDSGEAAATGVGSGFQGNVEIVATQPKKSRNKRSKKSTDASTSFPTIPTKTGKTSVAGDGVAPLAEGVVDGDMPPPGEPSIQPNRMIIKRRPASGSSKKRGGEEAKPRPRRPRMKRPRSTESGRRSATEASDADDSWGEESMEEDRREEKGLRSSAYGTRDRSGRVKYVEEASENEGLWEITWISMVLGGVFVSGIWLPWC